MVLTYTSLTNYVQRWPDREPFCKRAPGVPYQEGKRSGFCSHFCPRFAVMLYSEVTVDLENLQFPGAGLRDAGSWF